jgi:sugar phosphate permease
MLSANPETLTERDTRSIQRRNLVVIWLSQTTISMATLVFGLTAPFLQTDLGLSRAEIGLLAGSFNMVSFVVAVPAGLLSDRFGAGRVLATCLVSFSIVFCAAAIAPSFLLLLIPTILAGIGYNAVLPTTTKAVNDWFPARIRATAMGIKQTGLTFGGMLAGLIIPSIAILTNWRIAIVFLCAIVLIVGIAVHLIYTERPILSSNAVKLDRAGFVRFFTNRNLVLFALAACLFNVVQSSLTNFLILYLNQSMALPAVEAGFYLALLQGGGIVGRVGWGTISDRLLGGRRKGGWVALAVAGVVLSILMALLSPATPIWALGLIMIFGGLTVLSWAVLYVTITAEVGGKEHAGLASGTAASISVCGLLFGPPLFGAIVDISGSYLPAWLTLAGVMVVALLIILIAKEGAAKKDTAVTT